MFDNLMYTLFDAPLWQLSHSVLTGGMILLAALWLNTKALNG